MADIIVTLVDNATIRIICERHIAAELNDFFTFKVPGYKFMPAYRNGGWDGKIKLFNILTGDLLAGLFPYVAKYAADHNYTLETEDSGYGFPDTVYSVDQSFLDDFYQALKMPHSVRDYQNEAIKHAIERRRALLISPTGSGKSLLAYIITRYVLGAHKGKVLIVVPIISLVTQLLTDFADYGYDPTKVHIIYSGKDKQTNKRVIITTWQSIYKLPKAWFDQFDAVIGDEAHNFKAKSLTSIMNKSTKALYRIGLTGTLDGTQTHQLVLEGLFGTVRKVTDTKTLQDRGQLAPVQIQAVNLVYSQASIDKLYGGRTFPEYRDEVKFVLEHPKRNNFIANLALNTKGNTLVLFRFVDHGRMVYDLIKAKAADNRKVFYISGSVDVEDREAIRRIVETQEDAIIVASMGTFSTGINIRNLHNLILSSALKARIKVLQSIGRGLRIADNGQKTTVIDLMDNLPDPDTGKMNVLMRHAIERLKLYKSEQFPYKIIKVDIE